MSWALSWLMGSALGRCVAGGLLLGLALLALAASIYRRGVKAERARAAARKLQNIRERMKVDDETARMPRAERRKELERWFRD